MSGQLQNTGCLTSRQTVLVLNEQEQIWRNFRVSMPKFSINFEEILCHANGNFEEQK
jgi:hypothetical protein